MVGLLAGLEHTQHQGRKEHCPVTCLGRGRHQFSFDPVNLTPAQTSGKFQQQKLVAAVFPGLNQQVLAFLGSQHFHFFRFGR